MHFSTVSLANNLKQIEVVIYDTYSKNIQYSNPNHFHNIKTPSQISLDLQFNVGLS